MKPVSFSEATVSLRSGKIGVLPTDTLYGLVASVSDPEAVERVYRTRGRDEGKPCIVLIGDISDLERFDIHVRPRERGMLESVWPGKVSVILPCPSRKWRHIHRGTDTIAFRIPDVPELRALLRETGPLIAPSANPSGLSPAKTIDEAMAYFSENSDFSVDGGRLSGEPSTVVEWNGTALRLVRQGAVTIDDALCVES